MQLSRLTEAQSAYLDFVRGASALAVLFGHAAGFFLQGSFFKNLGVETLGVLLFFLLSGFLISYSVFRKHTDEGYRFRDYFIDRFCRIYCAFIPALLFVLIMDISSLDLLAASTSDAVARMPTSVPELPGNYTVQSWFGNLFMLQGYPLFKVLELAHLTDGMFVRPFGSGGPFWTISIEWWLYMTFGISAYFLCRGGGKLRPWLWLFLGLVALQPFYHLIGGVNDCLSLLWVLGMGASFAFLRLPVWFAPYGFFNNKERWRRLNLMVFAFFCLSMLGRLAMIKKDTGFWAFSEFQFSTFLACALFSMLLMFGTFERVGRGVKKAVTFLADISYSLYLTHFTIIMWLFLRFPGHEHDPAFFLLASAVSLVTAVIFWWLFERHHRALAKRLKVIFRRARASSAFRGCVIAPSAPARPSK